MEKIKNIEHIRITYADIRKLLKMKDETKFLHDGNLNRSVMQVGGEEQTLLNLSIGDVENE